MAFWLKKGKSGTFLSGTLDLTELSNQTSETEKVSIVLFKNTRKAEGEKTPDYRGYVSKPANRTFESIPEEVTDLEPF